MSLDKLERMSGAQVGLTVTHRRYVPYSHAHYAGNLVDGAYSLGLFGDVATEVCIRTDGDEGLFASYSDVQFRAPGAGRRRARGDRRGGRRRAVGPGPSTSGAVVVGRGRPDRSGSAAEMLAEPVVATTATGVVVVPADRADETGAACRWHDTPRTGKKSR